MEELIWVRNCGNLLFLLFLFVALNVHAQQVFSAVAYSRGQWHMAHKLNPAHGAIKYSLESGSFSSFVHAMAGCTWELCQCYAWAASRSSSSGQVLVPAQWRPELGHSGLLPEKCCWPMSYSTSWSAVEMELVKFFSQGTSFFTCTKPACFVLSHRSCHRCNRKTFSY